jgi:hypothetical protein
MHPLNRSFLALNEILTPTIERRVERFADRACPRTQEFRHQMLTGVERLVSRRVESVCARRQTADCRVIVCVQEKRKAASPLRGWNDAV